MPVIFLTQPISSVTICDFQFLVGGFDSKVLPVFPPPNFRSETPTDSSLQGVHSETMNIEYLLHVLLTFSTTNFLASWKTSSGEPVKKMTPNSKVTQ